MFKLYTIYRQMSPTVAYVVGSLQASLRHMKMITYRCFLPNLTDFMSFHCLGPIYQHYLHKTASKTICLQMGFNPTKADCGLQSTANSPSSTINSISCNTVLYYLTSILSTIFWNFFSKFNIFYLLKTSQLFHFTKLMHTLHIFRLIKLFRKLSESVSNCEE